MNRGLFGWDSAGNCLWCGEAGRCKCDHSRQAEAGAQRIEGFFRAMTLLDSLMQEITFRPSLTLCDSVKCHDVADLFRWCKQHGVWDESMTLTVQHPDPSATLPPMKQARP